MMRKNRKKRLLFETVICVFVGLTIAQEQKPTVTTSDSAARAMQEAQEYYRKGSFDQAIAKYSEVLKTDAQAGQANAGLVRCYLKQDKGREAADILQKALVSKPSDPDLRVVQGELLFRQGKIYEAEKVLVDVINAGNTNARAYLALAKISSAIAMYAREYRMISKAHELDPSDPDIQKLWMGTLSRAERIKTLEEYLAKPSNDDEDTRNSMVSYLAVLKARQASTRGACHLASEVSSTETDLIPLLADPKHLRGYGLPVGLNGQKSKLRLDTGAGGLLINRKLAGRAGIQPAADLHMWGVGDKADPHGYVGYADSIRIGNLEFHDCPVVVIEGRSVADEDGLIGADVFAKFLIEIDFPGEKLRLSPLPPRPGETPVKAGLATDDDEKAGSADSQADGGKAANGPKTSSAPKYYDRYIAPEMNGYARVYRFGHGLLVPTKVNDISGKLFLIDSGAFDNIITPDAAQEVTKVHGADWFKVRGISGEVRKVYTTDELTLEFGHLRQRKALVALNMSRLSRRVGTEISGTLGFAMLDLLKVRLDYRDALADFEYSDPSKRH